MRKPVRLHVNGEDHELLVEENKTLLEVLRDDLSLTGTKQGCDIGTCGSCTVLIGNKPTLSCITLAVACNNKDITTIEGMRRGDQLHPVQKAFIAGGAIQCGMCTPGMILSAKALLDEKPHPTELEIREAVSGNLCRCTGYVKIIEAIAAAANET